MKKEKLESVGAVEAVESIYNGKFEEKLSVAETVIGAKGLNLAKDFRACVENSTGDKGVYATAGLEKDKTTVIDSHRDLFFIDKADGERLETIATAQCAAKVYGGPGGMGN